LAYQNALAFSDAYAASHGAGFNHRMTHNEREESVVNKHN